MPKVNVVEKVARTKQRPHQRQLSILVANSVVNEVQGLAKHLKNHEVRIARDFVEAKGQMNDQVFDLIFLDADQLTDGDVGHVHSFQGKRGAHIYLVHRKEKTARQSWDPKIFRFVSKRKATEVLSTTLWRHSTSGSVVV